MPEKMRKCQKYFKIALRHTFNLQKKPVCRIGCGLGQRLDGKQSKFKLFINKPLYLTVGGPLPVSPRVAPVLIPLRNRTLGIFQVAMPSNEAGRNASSVQQQTAVSFLFRVVDPSENISLYFWQVSEQY